MTLSRRAIRRAGFLVAFAALAAGAVLAIMSRQPAASASSAGWIETWSAGPTQPTREVVNPAYGGFHDQTIRNIVFTSVGGRQIRIRLSNIFGTRPLVIGQASVGEVASGGTLSSPAYPVKFAGRGSVRIPAGQEVVSDPVPLAVAPLEDIAVSVYVPDATGPATYHFFGQQDNYIAPGDHVTDPDDGAFTTRAISWYFLDGVDVLSGAKRPGTVVALGDSITDGIGSADGANDRWPNFLARRLDARYGDAAPAVVDEGIGGNRVLNRSACYGQSAVARFGRDVLGQPGVRDVIVLEGINDIGYSAGADIGCLVPNTNVSAAQIIAGYKTMITEAHAHGIKIFGGTLTPFESSWIWSREGQAKWDVVNHWIRTSGAFDGVVDFARAVADPHDADYLNPAYDSGDGLHLNDAGYAAMAGAIDLSRLG
jgi:lysophospholipase L1-like esterase